MRTLLLVLLAIMPTHVWAHSPHAALKAPHWTLDAWVLAPLGLALVIYVIGLVRLKARSAHAQPKVALFVSGWLVLTLSVVSPLHEAGERSFTLHMIEHELIMLVAALLLPLSRPVGVMLWAFPAPARQGLAAAIRGLERVAEPVTATALQALALLAWHAPPLFDRALSHPAWHVAQHLSFLVTALLFWWAMIRTSNKGLAALCLFATSVVGAGLGALMAFSASPWYAPYAAMGMTPYGLSPEQDQQVAGLIMWVPGGTFHAAAAIVFLWRYLASRADSPATASR